ncbi:hypothetical protein Dsin_006740 [Dipteronia sinensis]|uniref:Uncharacterized protein n=1 Tax=Dipteronia sinensis TaxID=43782 RepID=A0AAE0AZU9_9ROSI|nr:hypothetical protein Dsin_006740 [Dipteronia sinensis]
MIELVPVSRLEPSNENGHQSSSQKENEDDADMGNGEKKVCVAEEPTVESPPHPTHDNSTTESGSQSFLTSIENIIFVRNRSLVDNCPCEVTCQENSFTDGLQESVVFQVQVEELRLAFRNQAVQISRTDQRSSMSEQFGQGNLWRRAREPGLLAG